MQQTKEVSDGGAVLAGPQADLFRTQHQFRAEACKGVGSFDRIEVFALDILDQGDFQQAVIRDIPEHNWDLLDQG